MMKKLENLRCVNMLNMIYLFFGNTSVLTKIIDP
jgi:hypothetical protein